jgi:hypothetical protein
MKAKVKTNVQMCKCANGKMWFNWLNLFLRRYEKNGNSE